MTVQPEDLFEILKQIRKDLTSLQVRTTDALNTLTALNLPSRPKAWCPHCKSDFPGPRTLSEHLYTSHDGPEPDHWANPPAVDEPEAEAAA